MNAKLETSERTNDMALLVELKSLARDFVRRAEDLVEQNQELDSSIA